MSYAGAPRPRYVAFRIEARDPVPRRAVQEAISSAARHVGIPGDRLPRLTRYEAPHGILWCDHRDLPVVRAILPLVRAVRDHGAEIAVSVTTLSTSGTILGLTDRIGMLTKRGDDKGKRPAAEPKGKGNADGAAVASTVHGPGKRPRGAVPRRGA